MFKKGDKVIVKHDKNLGVCTVSKAKDKTDMIQVGVGPVGYYVRIDTPDGKTGLGYHAKNLEKA